MEKINTLCNKCANLLSTYPDFDVNKLFDEIKNGEALKSDSIGICNSCFTCGVAKDDGGNKFVLIITDFKNDDGRWISFDEWLKLEI